ncbi:hypothetical protein [Thermomonas sp.]|uniref:hypothetical protein n=1 Tax=Thermomonas sp. TaxID=1971895 RepID=UPI002487617F|nr:hypothetical protein [Thermomonas sp.]MDI1253068.1 hypothetical protein [Thermomonas sp.]
MNMQTGDIDEDDDNMIDQEEEGSDKAEQRGEIHITSTSEVSSRDPIIINR